ncbi:hypothetical protein [Tardiphaga sp. OK245]|uniref:hypothetical protein n=1 Tax=Tardiphaga sp. OK245 TaxID=1855306 RepID=UPI0008A79A24|nr:hypothetical protein [Tardiphaga sp. OK245]SEI03420.1 hypothetical protein SAMN05216367_3112 [Tardiphaga sp. OK245]
MSERVVGVVASGDAVIVVDADVPNEGAITIVADATFKLQKGDRAGAYQLMHQRIADYVREKKIKRAVIKASAVSQAGKPTLAHFQSAELRGVAMSALHHGGANVDIRSKANISKTFGERKADEYVKDDDFWDESITGKDLRGGSREAALLILASRDK